MPQPNTKIRKPTFLPKTLLGPNTLGHMARRERETVNLGWKPDSSSGIKVAKPFTIRVNFRTKIKDHFPFITGGEKWLKVGGEVAHLSGKLGIRLELSRSGSTLTPVFQDMFNREGMCLRAWQCLTPFQKALVMDRSLGWSKVEKYSSGAKKAKFKLLLGECARAGFSEHAPAPLPEPAKLSLYTFPERDLRKNQAQPLCFRNHMLSALCVENENQPLCIFRGCFLHMLRVLLHHNNNLKITFYLSKGSPLAPLINPTPVPLHLTEGDCRMITQVQPLCMMEHTLEPLGFEIEDQPLCLIGLCHYAVSSSPQSFLHLSHHLLSPEVKCIGPVPLPSPHLTQPNHPF